MSEISPKTKRLLALSMLNGIGPSALRRIAALPDFEATGNDKPAYLLPVLSKALQEPGAWNRALDDAEKQIEEARRFDARILSALDTEYPRFLSATKDDPFLLFVRGRLAPNPEKSVAIIGTREPTEHGTVIAQRIASFFVSKRWSVVSGLALGCDAIAHQATLDANGHTVAVLAHGLHTIAPARHRKLADDILTAGGALVSEYRFGQSARPQQFVKRDRTQAGMARGVVMVQSDLKGGSLHASRAALDYGRWLAVPYPTLRDRNKLESKVQANLMIAEGPVEGKQDILRCSAADLKRVIILRGKQDYEHMLNLNSSGQELANSSHPTLL